MKVHVRWGYSNNDGTANSIPVLDFETEGKSFGIAYEELFPAMCDCSRHLVEEGLEERKMAMYVYLDEEIDTFKTLLML